jgi:hypothetical protein
MKISTSILIFLFSFQLISAQSMILSIATEPADPSTKDTILIFAEYQFPSSACLLDSKGATPIDFQIQAYSHYCLGPLTALCHALDTFKIDPLPEGEYSFMLNLSSGMGDVPCSPGIVIDDLDTLNFTVSSLSQTEDPDQSDFYLFPNPTIDQLTFSAPLQTDANIMNISGRIIRSISSGSVSIDVADLPSGIYLLSANGHYYRWLKW